MAEPILPEEVKKRLQRLPPKSSSVPDKITYDILKKLDPQGNILGLIYEICRKSKKIPAQWKTSHTILIHKKDDTNNINNWRPISLQNTIYKTYAAIIARRLATWATETNSLSPNQKGFLPIDGCLEHTYTIQSTLQHARRKRKNITIIWMDLRDAFGSVPHSTLFEMLDRAGLATPTLNIIKDIYTDSSTRVKTNEGLTASVNITQGVKQGCPLSPILFNFVIEGALTAINSANDGFRIGKVTVKSLAYADNLCIISETKEHLNSTLRELNKFTKWAGLSFSTHK